jgi:hypothetical protein
MQPGCIGKSDTNNLPTPIDLPKNPNGKKKLFFNDVTQKSTTLVHTTRNFKQNGTNVAEF